jgi:hypothetical protein
MLPHHHFILSGLSAGLVGFLFFPGFDLGLWVFVSGLVSIIIDWDAVALTLWGSKTKKKLQPYRNPVKIFSRYRQYMDALAETGVLKTLIVTHILSSVVIIFVFKYYANDYLTPAVIGVLTHLITDIPHIDRIKRMR